MTGFLKSFGWGVALCSMLCIHSCSSKLDINRRCCQNEYEIITQNYSASDSFRLFIPQAFTPNDDGINDIFRLKGRNYTVRNMVIKRGLRTVFQSSEHIEAFWDGGDEKDGLYKYDMTIRTDHGDDIELKGTVCLMRIGSAGEKLYESETAKICECVTGDMIDTLQGAIYEGKDCATNGFSN